MRRMYSLTISTVKQQQQINTHLALYIVLDFLDCFVMRTIAQHLQLVVAVDVFVAAHPFLVHFVYNKCSLPSPSHLAECGN